MKKTFILIAIFITILDIIALTYHFAPRKTILIPTDPSYPVLERILQCESDGQHYATTGQVLIKINKNGTYDTGLYQINSIWGQQATALGYDLTRKEDNKAFALWLYKNKGTEAWFASKQCWNK
jgi:hypothetical protein